MAASGRGCVDGASACSPCAGDLDLEAWSGGFRCHGGLLVGIGGRSSAALERFGTAAFIASSLDA